MYSKLTRLRLSLAAALVVGGVAAPLAYAAIGEGKAPAANAALVVSDAPGAQTMPLGAASSGDNPYQLYVDAGGQSGCVVLNLPPDQDFVLESVVFSGLKDGTPTSGPYLVGLVKKDDFVSTALYSEDFLVGGFVGYAGRQTFNLLIRPAATLQAAAVGDIFSLQFCTGGRQFVSGGVVFLTGQRVTSSVTAAAVSDFHARLRPSGTTLRWTTGSESQILGFNVWRYRNGKAVKVNRLLIRARRSGEPAGSSYTFVDRGLRAKRGLTYRLQLVDLNGRRSWFAAFAVAT